MSSRARRVVFDEEPVAHVLAVAVDGDRSPLQGGQDDDGNQLLRHLIGAVVVGAVTDHHRQAEGPVPCSRKVVGGRLARRVGRVRPVRRGISERSLGAERAVDLVGRYVEEAEALPRRALQATPVVGRGLEQRHRPLHVGSDEIHGAVDRTVDMGFSGEVDHRMRPRQGHDPTHGAAVADIGVFEAVVPSVQCRTQSFSVPGIGQQVHGHDRVVGFHQPPYHAGADEARPAGHKYSFHASSPAVATGHPPFALCERALEFREPWMPPISFGEQGLCRRERPLDTEGRIVPQQALS